MILIYLFWLHMFAWLLYVLFFNEYPYAKKLQSLKHSGYLEKHIQKAVDNTQLHKVQFKHNSDYRFMFNPKRNEIIYSQESYEEYTLDELFSTLHELAHAKQLEEKNLLYRIRIFWGDYIRSGLLFLFVCSIVFVVVNYFTLHLDFVWLAPTFLIALHYLFAILVIWNERDANRRAYNYLIEHYDLSQEEQRYLRRHSVENGIDYFLNIPLLLIAG